MPSPKRGAAPQSVFDRMSSRVQRAWGESPFYQARLKGPAPDRLLRQPRDPRTPDAELGAAIVSGRIAVGEEILDCEGDLDRLWDIAAPNSRAAAFLQEFAWLPHCAATGEAGVEPARALIGGWLKRHEKWSPEAWEPYVAAERLTQLCCHAAFALKGADAMWRSRLLASMARQTRHVAKSGHRAQTGYERLMTALGLTLAAHCLPGCGEAAAQGVELLRRELRLQIRPDGGHVSRNPSQQLQIVIRLQMLLDAVTARAGAPPGFLAHVLGRAAANVQFHRLGDGGLALFNGAYEDDAAAVAATHAALDPAAAPTGFARHTCYQRLECARSVVIADVGASRPEGGFRSATSFNFASGKSRIVVNCGSGAHLSEDWANALKSAAAHSTVSAEFPLAAGLSEHEAVVHRRAEEAFGRLVEIERRFGLYGEGPLHARRLYLSSGGAQLRGEDRFSGLPAAAGAGVRLRFHLHPGVKASISRDGNSVILALPNREGWRFRSSLRRLSLEKSVYCGAGGAPAATDQIVLGPLDLEAAVRDDIVVRWAFLKLDGGGPDV
jgi:uncharacterized heparinase superfamily protein